jgi:hypothetical protein
MQILKNSVAKANDTNAKPFKTQLNSLQTVKYLKEALAGKDLTMFNTVSIDRREAAKFIERQSKILRYVSQSAAFPSITSLVEEIYYSAFEETIFHEMPDYKDFRDMLNANLKVSD